MAKILITGASGQLGQCLKKIAKQGLIGHDYFFADSAQLNITDVASIDKTFAEFRPDFVVNCAAYTAVDLAEDQKELAFAINAFGVESLAKVCNDYGAMLIHISTDYVFDGETELPYTEDDFTNPQSVYGASKRKGEELALEANPKTIVIRTSWLYSEFSKNFVKTMLHLFQTKEELGIVGDQFGQPTNANDLAEVIIKIVESPQHRFGIYHFSNSPETTWYLFAEKIAELSKSIINIKPISTAEFPTKANRPRRSTMDLNKISTDYNVEIYHWENRLEDCIQILKD